MAPQERACWPPRAWKMEEGKEGCGRPVQPRKGKTQAFRASRRNAGQRHRDFLAWKTSDLGTEK